MTRSAPAASTRWSTTCSHRYAEARQIAEGIAERALSSLARSMAEAGHGRAEPSRLGSAPVWSRPSSPATSSTRTAIQVLSERFGLPGSIVLDATTVKTVLAMLQSPKIDDDAWVTLVELDEDDEGVHLTVGHRSRGGPGDRPLAIEGSALCDAQRPSGGSRLRDPPATTDPAGAGQERTGPRLRLVAAQAGSARTPREGQHRSRGSPAEQRPRRGARRPRPRGPSRSMAWPASGASSTEATSATATTTRHRPGTASSSCPWPSSCRSREQGPVRASASSAPATTGPITSTAHRRSAWASRRSR